MRLSSSFSTSNRAAMAAAAVATASATCCLSCSFSLSSRSISLLRSIKRAYIDVSDDGMWAEDSLFVGGKVSGVFAEVSASTSASTADSLAILVQENDDFSEFSSHSTMLGPEEGPDGGVGEEWAAVGSISSCVGVAEQPLVSSSRMSATDGGKYRVDADLVSNGVAFHAVTKQSTDKATAR